DINKDVSSLYVEIIDKNRSYYKCTICGRKLSRKQRLETHLSCVNGKEGYHIRKCKRYIDDPSVPVPKSTKLAVASVQQHVPTPPSRFLSQSFPLNLKQY
ncbi:unnamed protein product, partial [Hapterophycus canaliculatus]